MASADWQEATDGLDASTVDRGVTNGIARPNGGGAFVYGFNSLANTPGAVALYATQANFAPMAKGGRITAAIQRGISGGPLNFSPFIFLGLGGTSVNDVGYMLGLQDDDPHRIVLRKGQLVGGLPAGAVGTNGILARSTATYAPGTWLHLLLDMIVNANGDVLLKCQASDLAQHSVATPSWAAIPGIGTVVDDALGVNTGSPALTSGRGGFGVVTKDVTRRAYFDRITLARQL